MNLPSRENIESIQSIRGLSALKEEYHLAVAKIVDEARKLLDEGFDYVCQKDGIMLFRKRK